MLIQYFVLTLAGLPGTHYNASVLDAVNTKGKGNVMARFVWTVALLVVSSVAQAVLMNVEVGGEVKENRPPVPRWPERLIGDERLLLNNDGTNLFWRDDLSMEMVRRHAAECPDAVTTYLVCPNGIQKMMYPSEIEELSTRGALPRLVAEGHDPFGYFLTELKTRGFEVLVTFRMNEVHNVDKADEPDLSRFWREHPEWRVEPGAPAGNWMAQCMDYSRPEVQEYNTALICELLEKYRPDGVELDWMRFPRHLSGTPEEVWAKRGMLTDVVAAVRLKADELAGRLKRPVRVAVRIPSSPAGCRNLGVDLADWTARGLVDFVTAAPFLASDFAMPLEELRALMGGKKVPLYAGIEIGHSGKNHSEASLHAAGLGLLDSGADGLYLFNFPCWRESRQAPPWYWVPPMRNSTLLARGALEFPLINGHHRIGGVDLPAPLPVTLGPGESAELPLRLPAAAVEGFESVLAAALNLEAEGALEAAFNGAAPGVGGSLPADAVRAGENTLHLRNTGADPVTLNRAALALTLPPVAPTVFPELPPEQCIHISEKGSDENPGTLEQPVETMSRARILRRERGLLDGKSTCYWFHEGDHDMSRLQEIIRRTSDNDLGHIYLRAWPGEKPVLGPGLPVRNWELSDHGIWKGRPVGIPRGDFFVNGVRAIRARGAFPDGWKLWGDTDNINGVAGYHLPDRSIMEWRSPERMWVGYLNSWAHMQCRVSAVKPDENGGIYLIMSQPDFYLGLHKEGVQATTPAYLENAIELLDEPGEYYYDSQEDRYYYLPRAGEDMATASVVYGDGSVQVYLHNVWIEGITFAHISSRPEWGMDVQANFTISSKGVIERNGFVAALHNEYDKSFGGFILRGAQDARFIRCSFTRFDGSALDLDLPCSEVIVDGCTFEDIGGTAIQIGGVSKEDHHPRNRLFMTQDNVVANCVIRNCGVLQEGSVGIFVGYANGTVIANNEIYDLPYSGISVGWGWGEEDAGGGNYPIPFKYATPTPCGANRVENNHIYNVMQKRDDGGGVYTLGNQPGTVILGNHIHDNGPGGPGGIYLDEGSGYIEVTGNNVHGVVKPMNYNNHAQDRISTCFEHGNSWNE